MSIQKVLIANRGEIAVRIIKTLQRLGIESVIVYHAVDAKTPAVQMADKKVELLGDLPVSAYLDMEQIIQACKDMDADAVHPGFGFLSENAEFATRVADNDIIFIGPSAEVINLMGNKVRARSFCIEHGFSIAPSVVDEGDDKAFISRAEEIGVPLLIKAAAGGGGKGMQIVRDPAKLEESIALARGEALRSFGDSLVYAERFVDSPRHIEVQILADKHGNVLHLNERECSIQRRFQKVIEEAPSATLTPEQREEICNTAVAIAAKAGYENAGTVEFIYAPNGEFYFLEMNTRIQVEHPITEMITGVDLVEEQIKVAEGQHLSHKQSDIPLNGHAIEVRLYAEDADNDFTPATGPLLKYQLPEDLARIENGFFEGQLVSSAFDPMLSKIIVHGQNREEATEKMIEALKQSTVLGVTSNRDFLIRALGHAAYKNGDTHTGFIAEHAESLKRPVLQEEQLKLLLGLAAMSNRDFNDTTVQPQEPHITIGNWRYL
ncbi:MAG: ATP-grasp domain-containing protein [Halieaceae bacterium]|jgi:acetyl-CoA/propionyl-CoA carboxylase, biotin carboxylase, biotin carboxyl carrier protein|nr:ATP-grasp domain-containing protein [Halieaceae bacterium]